MNVGKINSLIGYVFILCAAVTVRVTALVAMIYMANEFSEEIFSKISTLYNVGMLTAAFIGGGWLQTQLKYGAKLDKLFYIYSIIYSTILVFIMLIFLPFYFNFNSVFFVISIAFYSIIIQALCNEFIINTSDRASSKLLFISGILLWFLIIYPAEVLSNDFLLVSSVFLMVVVLGVMIFLIKNKKIDDVIELSTTKILKSFTMPAYISSLATIPVILFCYMLFSSKVSTSEQAIFNVSYQWFQILVFIPVAISPKLIRYFSTVEVGAGSQKVICIISTFLIVLFSIVQLGSNVVFSLYPELDGVLLEAVWTNMLFASFFSALSSVFGFYILSNHSMWDGLKINSIWAITFMLIFFEYFSDLSAEGFSKVFLYSYMSHLVICLLYYMRKVKF
jgi:hypothetical protein